MVNEQRGKKEQSYKPIEAVVNTLRLLEYVGTLAKPTTTKTICEKTNIKYHTLKGYLYTLEREGYVQRIGDTLYQGTTKFALIWSTLKNNLSFAAYEIKQLQKEINDETV